MKLRHPVLLRTIGLLVGLFLRWWATTLCRRIRTYDGSPHPPDPRDGRFIYSCWHESALAAVAFRARADVLISEHADGELIAQVCRHLGLGSIRGSSTRGGIKALLRVLHRKSSRHLVVTPDGPRGPRRQLQLGVVYLASRTGFPIVGMGAGHSNAWRAGSWDRFAVPLPGSAVHCVLTRPIHVPPDLDRNGLERWRQVVEEAMHRATREAEEWSARRTGFQPVPHTRTGFQPVLRAA